MIKKREDAKFSSFFYNGLTDIWPGVPPREMREVYYTELSILLMRMESRWSYQQEFVRNTPAYGMLVEIKDGKRCHAERPESENRVFFRDKVIIQTGSRHDTMSYWEFYRLVRYYVRLYCQKWGDDFDRECLEKKLRKVRSSLIPRPVHVVSIHLRKALHPHLPAGMIKTYEGSVKLNLTSKELDSFQQLRCEDTLTSLSADGVIKNPEALKEYRKLKVLALRGTGITEIGFISGMKNLQELILVNNQISDLSPVKGLPRLRSLHIGNNPVRDMSVVYGLPALNHLIADVNQIPDQAALNRVPDTVMVSVIKMIPTADPFTFDTKTVMKRKMIKEPPTPSTDPEKLRRDALKLNIRDHWLYSGIVNALGYDPVIRQDMEKLAHLNCGNKCKPVNHYFFLNQYGDYSALQYAVNLRKLDLSGRIVDDYSVLKNCSRLILLDLSQSNFEDLSILTCFPRLKFLNLSGCRLTNWEALKSCTNLVNLNLSKTNIQDFRVLSGLANLLWLDLSWTEGLYFEEAAQGLTETNIVFPNI